MIFILPFVFGAIGAAVGAVAGAFTAHAAGEKDRQAAKHHRQVANELTDKYASLEKKYYEFADKSKKQIDDLTRQNVLSEIEKDCLRLAVRLQQNVIYLMWEIDREPTAETLNRFQAAVEQTNQVLNQLKEELIVVPDDYYERLFNTIEAAQSSKQISSEEEDGIGNDEEELDTDSKEHENDSININNSAATTSIHTISPISVSYKKILSVDLGRTSTKTCVSREPYNVAFISANVKQMSIKQIRGLVFEAKAIDPLMDLWMEYQGSGYAVGQLAADFGANLGLGQSKVEDALVKVLAAAGYFKLKDEIAIVLSLPFLSLEQFEIEKAQLISMIGGPHIFNFRGEAIYLNITKVWVMPQGYGSLLWTQAQPNKASNTPDFTNISVGIIDIGYQTIDMIIVDNFHFSRGSSWSEDFGMSKFYELVAKEIEGADSQSLALISAVNKPKKERFYSPRRASKPTNLDDFLPNLIEQFSREICSRVLAWLPERVTDVIITGGGGEFYWEDIQRLLKEAKINAYLAAPSRQANALGQYLYGEVQIRSSEPKENVDTDSEEHKNYSINTPKSAANPINTKNILSIDLGRLYTKACISRDSDNVVLIPSYVKDISFGRIFYGDMYEYQAIPNNPLKNIWLEYKGSGYAVGQLAAKFGADLGFGQSKVEDVLVKVLVAARYFKLKDEISVVISLPFISTAQFEQEKLELSSIITGPHLMKFRGESVFFNITKVWVLPEGYCSLLWEESKPNRDFSIPDLTKITVGIVDIGYENINFIMVDNCQWVKDTSESEYFGMREFYSRIAKEIEGAEHQSLALISAVNQPKGKRFYRPKGAWKAINLDDFLPYFIEQFSREICYRILAWLPEEVTNIIITGGGGEFFWEDIQRLLKESKINTYLAAPSRQANALGQYIYGEAQLSAAYGTGEANRLISRSSRI